MNHILLFGKFTIRLRDEIIKDHSFIGAASLSYYLLLATFPAIIAFIGVLSLLPAFGVENLLQNFIANELPGSTADLIQKILVSARKETSNSTVISVGFIGALWASTSGMVAIIKQLNIAYNVENTPNFINIRFKGLKLTLIFSFITILISLGVIGLKFFFSEIIDTNSFGIFFYTLNKVLIFLLLVFLLGLLYYLAPRGKRPLKFITPGSIFGSVFIMLGTSLFDYYISNFSSYNKTYGSIGGVIVYMLWLNLISLVIICGAQINCVLKRMS